MSVRRSSGALLLSGPVYVPVDGLPRLSLDGSRLPVSSGPSCIFSATGDSLKKAMQYKIHVQLHFHGSVYMCKIIRLYNHNTERESRDSRSILTEQLGQSG